jgi:CubicO group peptidase (beta-lactamase class C family)
MSKAEVEPFPWCGGAATLCCRQRLEFLDDAAWQFCTLLCVRLRAYCTRLVFGVLPVLGCAGADQQPDRDSLNTKVAEALAPIRERASLPALAGAIATADGVLASGVVGVRKSGSRVNATLEDEWHLGSDTKAMTATLIGLLIDDGKLRFESAIADEFPDLAPKLPEAIRKITVEQLLAHRAALPWEADWGPLSAHGSLMEQRVATVLAAGSAVLVATPGASFNYSNWDYVILGAIAERITGRPWEELMRQRIFVPLKMEHAGFGGTGTHGAIDQPWPHVNGIPLSSNGPEIDFRAVMAPAAGVHCPIGDWAKFTINELKGLRGEPGLLSPETFKRLHTPAFGGDYAGGWNVVQRDWAKGTAYTHGGTNNMNYSIAWIAPRRDVVFLVCTNEGQAFTPCDEAVHALLNIYDSMTR